MVRFYLVIFLNIFFIMYFVPKMIYYSSNREKFTEGQCYQVALSIIYRINKSGGISVISTGTETLPGKGGYAMYSNHQGRYDALGILYAHERPCTTVMELKRSKVFITSQFLDLLNGKRLDRSDFRQQVTVFREIEKELKEGRIYLIFPEGRYSDNHNRLQDFSAGSFSCAVRAKCPIVPVAIYDTYRAFTGKSLAPVKTQVHFLNPLYYSDYKSLRTSEIRDLVVRRISDKMNELEMEA